MFENFVLAVRNHDLSLIVEEWTQRGQLYFILPLFQRTIENVHYEILTLDLSWKQFESLQSELCSALLQRTSSGF